jgi:NAD(P) transhydrogenase subunit alpha
MELETQAETAGGYAREQSEEFLKKEQDVIGKRMPNVDVVISTAQVFGKRPPILITAEMVRMMKPGSIIVDLAAEQGGNCELTQAGATVEHQGVTIMGPVNLPASVPTHASQLYSKNVVNLIQQLYQNGSVRPDFADEIAKGCVITDSGTVANETVRQLLSEKGVTFA